MNKVWKLSVCFCVLGSLGLVGCGGTASGKAKVKGNLQENGAAVKLNKDESITVNFVPTAKDDKMFPSAADVKADGTYQVVGPTQDGIMPGEYMINVKINKYQSPEDRLKGQFEGAKNPLKYTVTKDSWQEIDIDIGKKTVTATKK